MLLENELVEVGKIEESERVQWMKAEDSLSFSLAVLIVLLRKYSSRLYDDVTLNLEPIEFTPAQKIELHYSFEGDQTFNSIFKLVQADLRSAFDFSPVAGFDIEWMVGDNQVGLKYRIRLSPPSSRSFYQAIFSSDPHSFFHYVFRNATRHYNALAENALVMHNMPIADLGYCTNKDVVEIKSVSYGQTDELLSAPEFLDQLFETTVEECPNRHAVVYGSKSITYLSLKKMSDRIAAFLMQREIGQGDVVGILLHRTLEAYAAMLAVMKCGAAYVTIDTDYPNERVRYILEDSTSQYLITGSVFQNNYSGYKGAVLNIDLELKAAFSDSSSMLQPKLKVLKRSSTDAAYIIYTSGSTGKPKGVVISHRAATNLVKAEKSMFRLKPSDKVAQGFSIAFDASIEEIWLAFASGASLYPIDKELMCSGTDVCEFINQQKITVLSTVPTLLAMMPIQLPSLRLLILGGESCSQELIRRWSNNKLRIVNTYGPTEATVIASACDCELDKKITIGKPIRNCGIFITDSSLKPVPVGVPGELCIAGVGLANGYQNNHNLTEEKFVKPPFELRENFPNRIYRSGDLGRFNEAGDIEFLGRIDRQVKLRGFRIELSEIESQILLLSNIKNSAVILKQDSLKGSFLVAFIVLEDKSQPFNPASVKDSLRKSVAPYMVPALFIELDEFPLLPSGKIDQKKLSELNIDHKVERETLSESLSEAEQSIYDVWKKYFSPKLISKKDDFFLDLGGHSLLAAKTVSELRLQPRFKNLSVLDVYKSTSIEKLALQFNGIQNGNANGNGKQKSITSSSKKVNRSATIRHFFCGIFQFFSFYFVFGFNLIRDLSLYAVFFYLYNNGHSLGSAISWGLISSVISYPLSIIIAIGTKWTLLGRVKEGRYRLWGGFYLRWWFVRKLFQILDLYHLAGTPLLPLVYRALGMKIGSNVHLETDHFAAFDLVSIGRGTSIDEDATINGFSVKDGFLTIGSITIGKNCFVGTRSVVSENTIMETGSRLEDLSLIPAGTKIPKGETWSGSPATCTSKINCAAVVNPPAFDKLHKLGVSILYCLLFSIIPIVAAVAFIPGITILMQFDLLKDTWVYLSLLPVVGVSFVVLLTIEVAILKWILVRQAKPGVYPVHGTFYIKHWIVDQLLRISLDYVGQLHATLYVTSWYRLLGMKIGRQVELSTAASTTPDLVQLDDGVTIADEVSLGSPHVEKGWMILAPVHMGYRSFAGNSAVIPAGTKIGDHSLVGVLSIAPKREDAEKTHATWFGSPPILFPKREGSNGYSEEKTYKPPVKLRLMRGVFELLRITLPPAAFILIMTSLITTGILLLERFGMIRTFLALPVIFGLFTCIMVLIVAAIKWLVIGKYKPFTQPLWTNFVWRLELVNALYEFFSSPLLLHLLQGTPFLAWYLRLMGSKIGKQCYIDTTGFLEWDLVNIGDRVIINENAVMQTHLFEDRVLKAARFSVGNDCVIGATSVVLYDSEMKDGSHLEDLSLLMKGEVLPGETHWMGIPAIESGENKQASKSELRTNHRQHGQEVVAG